MTDCPPCTAPALAAILAAVSGLAVLVGGLAAYGLIVALPRRWARLRADRLRALEIVTSKESASCLP